MAYSLTVRLNYLNTQTCYRLEQPVGSPPHFVDVDATKGMAECARRILRGLPSICCVLQGLNLKSAAILELQCLYSESYWAGQVSLRRLLITSRTCIL